MKKARELQSNLHKLQGHKPVDMTGRVRHDTVWQRAMNRWRPGMKITVKFDRKNKGT